MGLHRLHMTPEGAAKTTFYILIVLFAFELCCFYGFVTQRQVWEAASIAIAWGKEHVKKLIHALIVIDHHISN